MLVEIAGVFFHFDSKKRFFSICPSGFYLPGKEMYTNIIKGKEKIENTFLCYIVRI